ncbi:MAG: glycosyltransferase, partial [Christensenella sp.]
VCDAQICECSFDNVYKDKIVPETKETGKWVVGDRTDALNGQIDWKYFKSLACDKLYSSSLFSDGKRYPVGKHHEDEFFTHKVYYEITRIVFVDYSFYHYDHTRDDSITGATFNVSGLDSVEALRERTTFLKERNETALYNRMLDLYCWTTLDRIDKCKQNNITGARVDEIKSWLKEDLSEFEKANFSRQRLLMIKNTI